MNKYKTLFMIITSAVLFFTAVGMAMNGQNPLVPALLVLGLIVKIIPKPK